MGTDIWLAYVLRLASGILAIQAPYSPVSPQRAMAYAVAATYHGMQRNVDPYELIGIARNESDFQEDQRGPDGKDCGLTQTRVTITRYSCRALLRSYWLAFQEAAREMSEYNRACAGKPDYDRCRMNHYNSGVHYAKRGQHGAYYLRVMCFTEAARHGVVPGKACRRVNARSDIRRIVARRPMLKPLALLRPPTPQLTLGEVHPDTSSVAAAELPRPASPSLP